MIKKSNGEEREIKVREERKYNKKIIKILQFVNNTVSKLRRYCSPMPKVLEFEILDVGAFLVFGVPNPKYLTFGTLDGNAFSTRLCFFFKR